MKRVYMFGVAGSFVDSTAYITDVSRVDSAWINPHKLLIDRALYSLQLQYYVERLGCNYPICSVIFNTSERQLRKEWKKVMKRYNKAQSLTVITIPVDTFSFKAEEYRAIMNDGVPEVTVSQENKKDSKKSKKK